MEIQEPKFKFERRSESHLHWLCDIVKSNLYFKTDAIIKPSKL